MVKHFSHNQSLKFQFHKNSTFEPFFSIDKVWLKGCQRSVLNENTTVTKTLSVLGNILDQFLVSAIFSISCCDFIKSEIKQRSINFSISGLNIWCPSRLCFDLMKNLKKTFLKVFLEQRECKNDIDWSATKLIFHLYGAH